MPFLTVFMNFPNIFWSCESRLTPWEMKWYVNLEAEHVLSKEETPPWLPGNLGLEGTGPWVGSGAHGATNSTCS